MRYGRLGPGLTDVPHFYAAFAAGINVLGGIADGHGTHDFAVPESVDLTGVSRDARTHQCIRRKGHRLHLTFGAHVKRIRSLEKKKIVNINVDHPQMNDVYKICHCILNDFEKGSFRLIFSINLLLINFLFRFFKNSSEINGTEKLMDELKMFMEVKMANLT